MLTVKSGLSWPKICGGVQVNEIQTALTFSEVSRPEEYSRHENKHAHKLDKQRHVQHRCTYQQGDLRSDAQSAG